MLTCLSFRACLQELQLSKTHLDSLLSDTSSTLNLLTNLSNDFKAVESQTSNFQKQCEGLLSAQKHDLELATDIQDNLQYYEFLDPASRRLNAPGAGNTVRGQEFSDMLRRLDECLDYMEVHVSTYGVMVLLYHRINQYCLSRPSKKRPACTAPGIDS